MGDSRLEGFGKGSIKIGSFRRVNPTLGVDGCQSPLCREILGLVDGAESEGIAKEGSNHVVSLQSGCYCYNGVGERTFGMLVVHVSPWSRTSGIWWLGQISFR